MRRLLPWFSPRSWKLKLRGKSYFHCNIFAYKQSHRKQIVMSLILTLRSSNNLAPLYAISCAGKEKLYCIIVKNLGSLLFTLSSPSLISLLSTLIFPWDETPEKRDKIIQANDSIMPWDEATKSIYFRWPNEHWCFLSLYCNLHVKTVLFGFFGLRNQFYVLVYNNTLPWCNIERVHSKGNNRLEREGSSLRAGLPQRKGPSRLPEINHPDRLSTSDSAGTIVLMYTVCA